MFKGRTVFAQVLDFVPFKHFEYLALKFAANHWIKTLPAWSHFVCLAYAQIYKEHWKIELFFKWLKQNLSVKHFFGNSINAVKAQIWIAVWS